MFDEPLSSSADEYRDSLMEVLADYIISQLDDVQNTHEFNELRNHADYEIRQEAELIWQEIQQLKSGLRKI